MSRSLEIVNEKIEETKYPTGSLERPVWDDETIINKTELQQIKQDLEVLEIISKKKVDFVHLNNYLFLYDKNEEVLEKYNKYCFYQNEITLEELLKLKKWLEENENGN